MGQRQGNEEKILRVFFDKPDEKFHVRELARLTKLSPNTIINLASELSKRELIKREKKKHIVELSADFNEEFKKLKRIDNLQRILDSGIVEFLSEKFDTEAISVIGSYSRGEDVSESDVDIVAISKKDYQPVNLDKFEKIFDRKIHLLVVDYPNISEEFYINLINGILLKGYINKK